MTAKVLRERQWHTDVSHEVSYEWSHCPGSGFCFPCTEDGDIKVENLSPASQENLRLCMSDPRLLGPYFRTSVNRWLEPRQIECYCGEPLDLDGDTRCRKCGRWYNVVGQELNPPEMWEE